MELREKFHFPPFFILTSSLIIKRTSESWHCWWKAFKKWRVKRLCNFRYIFLKWENLSLGRFMALGFYQLHLNCSSINILENILKTLVDNEYIQQVIQMSINIWVCVLFLNQWGIFSLRRLRILQKKNRFSHEFLVVIKVLMGIYQASLNIKWMNINQIRKKKHKF